MGLPGAVVIPFQYGKEMVLYSADNLIEVVVDGAPPGPLGRKFVVEVGKPTRVPYEAGRFILEHLGYTGVVRVNETQTDTGVTYDVAGARAESLAKTETEDEKRFHRFVSDMVEDYIKRNKPVPQPPQAILDIIERRGYDLKKFGIKPIGWEDPVEQENKKLKDQLAALAAKVDALSSGKK